MFARSSSFSRHAFRNWAGNHSCMPADVHLPGSEAEVVDLVEQVRRRAGTMRVVGAGHSWSDIVCTQGHLVSLDKLDEVIAIDREASCVTVQAGIRLEKLVAHLHEHNLALPNLGSIAEQSVAGVISTGTHGTGVGLGNLSSTVRRMRLVTGRGEVLEVDAESHPEIFAAARVGLGCLGVITEVTLDCVPAFNLCERSWTLSFEEGLRQMQTLVDGHDHVKFWWLPHTGRMQVFAADRTEREPTPPSLLERIDRSGALTPVLAGIVEVGNRLPWTIPALNQTVAASYFNDYELVAQSDYVFNLAMPPAHMEAEYAVDRYDAEEALRQMRALIEFERFRVNFITEVRFVAADDIWLSCDYGRDSCHLGAYNGTTPRWRDYFEGVEQIALRLDGRPHWGKTFFAEGDILREVFPHFDDFAKVRERLDPDGVFVNDFVRRLFRGRSAG